MSTKEPDNDNVCPTCGKECKSYRGVKVHHAREHDESIAGERVSCTQCGETKHVRRANAERSEHHFCDRSCKAEWESENNSGTAHHHYDRIEVACAWCGEPKYVTKSKRRLNKRHFCDYDCLGKWRSENKHGENHHQYGRVEVECAQCGDTKRVKPSHVREHQFCDQECMGEWYSENLHGENNPNWGKDGFRYGSGWTEAKKERIRERQGRRCAGCDMDESENGQRLSVHHIQKARSFDDDEARNDDSILVALCRGCHKQWERMTPLRPQTPYLD